MTTTLKDLIRPDNTYRDEEALGFDIEGMAVEHLPAVQSMKYITMLPAFEERSPEDQRVFLWSLASSMNEALDVMQRERNQVLDMLEKKEEQLIALSKQNSDLSQALQTHMHNLNESANARAAELHEVKQAHIAEVEKLKAEG